MLLHLFPILELRKSRVPLLFVVQTGAYRLFKIFQKAYLFLYEVPSSSEGRKQ